MCRLAAFPPGTKPEEAHAVMKSFFASNDDGVGTAHVKDGKFVIHKYPISYATAAEKKMNLFDHMPFAGWTIAHVRMATHGENKLVNTHPFEVGDSAICHNGVWSYSELVKFVLSGYVKFSGETDSEVAAYLINKRGAKAFLHMPTASGVYLQLHRNGQLTALRCSGDLVASKQAKSFLLASQLPKEFNYVEVDRAGFVTFNPDGSTKEHFFANESSTYGYSGRRTTCSDYA